MGNVRTGVSWVLGALAAGASFRLEEEWDFTVLGALAAGKSFRLEEEWDFTVLGALAAGTSFRLEEEGDFTWACFSISRAFLRNSSLLAWGERTGDNLPDQEPILYVPGAYECREQASN